MAPETDAELIILNYKDNEALQDTIVNELEANRIKALTSDYWSNWCKVYLDGQVGALEGVIFNNWNEIDRIPEEAQLVGYGLDFGFTNDPTSVIAVYRLDNSIYVDEIVYQKGLANSEIAALLKSQQITGPIYADSAEPKSISDLSKYGLRVMGAQKGRDSINFGISVLQEYDMFVTKRSQNLKDELNRYHWMKDKEGRSMNVPIDAFNHAIDALRYLAIMKLKKSGGVKTFKII